MGQEGQEGPGLLVVLGHLDAKNYKKTEQNNVKECKGNLKLYMHLYFLYVHPLQKDPVVLVGQLDLVGLAHLDFQCFLAIQ